MFSTFKERLLLGIYIFVVISIPVGAYLVAQQTTIKSSASEPQKTTKKAIPVVPRPTIPPAKELLGSSQNKASAEPVDSSPPPSSPSATIATSYGPTLALKAALEGRPAQNQATRLFIGIAEGSLTSNPKFILSFTVDLPASGEYSNLSLAGLTPGSQYTALIKGSAQIATAVTFTMSPLVTNLNNGEPVSLTSGDLNEDNVINSADYSIAQKAAGTSLNSPGWVENADLNKDQVINAFDLAIIAKNIGKTGASGAWTSPVPSVATPSASLNTPPTGGPNSQPGSPPAPRQGGRGEAGHWIWVPDL